MEAMGDGLLVIPDHHDEFASYSGTPLLWSPSGGINFYEMAVLKRFFK